MKSGLLISIRVLFKNKLFTIITILNLTVGFSACLLLLKYVRYELSFDQFYPESEDVYRISYERFQNGDLDFHSALTMSALAPAIKRDFPEVRNAIRGCYEECLIYRKVAPEFPAQDPDRSSDLSDVRTGEPGGQYINPDLAWILGGKPESGCGIEGRVNPV